MYSCPVFPAPFIEEDVFIPLYILAFFVKTRYLQVHGFISGLSILFHCSIFLFLCQYHTVLMTVALQYNLKSGRLIPPALFFLLKIALAICSLCVFIHIVKFLFQFCEKCNGYLISCIGSVNCFRYYSCSHNIGESSLF